MRFTIGNIITNRQKNPINIKKKVQDYISKLKEEDNRPFDINEYLSFNGKFLLSIDNPDEECMGLCLKVLVKFCEMGAYKDALGIVEAYENEMVMYVNCIEALLDRLHGLIEENNGKELSYLKKNQLLKKLL